MRSPSPVPWILLLALAAPSQTAPPARPPMPAEPPRAALEELLRLLAATREDRGREQHARAAARVEQEALAQEIAALEGRLAGLETERKRLAADEAAALAAAREEKLRSEKARAALARALAVLGGTQERLAELLGRLPDPLSARPASRPAAPPPEPQRAPLALRACLRELETAAGRARSVELRRAELPLPEGPTPVQLLRLGGVAWLWCTLDGERGGWLDAAGAPRPLPEPLANLAREIRRAGEILRQDEAPALTVLPVPRPAGKEDR